MIKSILIEIISYLDRKINLVFNKANCIQIHSIEEIESTYNYQDVVEVIDTKFLRKDWDVTSISFNYVSYRCLGKNWFVKIKSK